MVRWASCLIFLVFSMCGCSRTGLEDLAIDDGYGAAGAGDRGQQGVGADGSGGHGGDGGGRGEAAFGAIGNSGGAPGRGGSGATGALSCTRDADCPNDGFCSLARCLGGSCVTRRRDVDGDGAIDVACGGLDCNDANPSAYPGAVEICGDGADNDCNGVADCLDPACERAPGCGCVPTAQFEVCQNGIDDDCNGTLDCNDPACVSTAACGCDRSTSENCGNGIDDDCDGQIDCADPDCKGTRTCMCFVAVENCHNFADDDCDGLIDCADPNCAVDQSCVCKPPGRAEDCGNHADDDCDGLVDCADPDCSTSSVCERCTTEVCDNGIDDDCDGAIDCADSGCRFAAKCAPAAELCNNGIDDDHDGEIDCSDSDCAGNPACVATHSTCTSALTITASGTYTGDTTGFVGHDEGTCGGAAGEAVFRLRLSRPATVALDTRGSNFDTALYVRLGSCGKGRELGCDDDNGGSGHSSALTFATLQPGDYYVFVDGFTVDAFHGPDEGKYVLNVDLDAALVEDCRNRVDDDGDGYADCADPDCTQAPSCKGCVAGRDPVPELGIGACTNGIDDDCDGAVDCADSDCAASKAYPTECCDGVDQNGNGIADDFSCRCVTSSDCSEGQICYGHSIGACGDPCQNYNGDICVFAQPGSTCNKATSQCEF